MRNSNDLIENLPPWNGDLFKPNFRATGSAEELPYLWKLLEAHHDCIVASFFHFPSAEKYSVEVQFNSDENADCIIDEYELEQWLPKNLRSDPRCYEDDE